jgi:hypothetical protein
MVSILRIRNLVISMVHLCLSHERNQMFGAVPLKMRSCEEHGGEVQG